MEGTAPILHVANARASIEWYAKLGFEVESEHAFGPDWPLYVRLRRGPAQLHLSEHRLDGGPVTHVYLYVEDVDSSIPAGMAAEDCRAIVKTCGSRSLGGFGLGSSPGRSTSFPLMKVAPARTRATR
jgi:catechol 2,3-dioxygenase-like lactoylglutathione lyase family enzyme